MRTLIYLFIGILFGITMFKSEAASWFRIYEMFRFEAFHMYGIIGSTVVLGILIIQAIKRFNITSFYGEPIVFTPKAKSVSRYLFGGFIFGLGWAITGACPGPLFAQIGAGFGVIFITFLSATLGVWVYGYFRDKLPH